MLSEKIILSVFYLVLVSVCIALMQISSVNVKHSDGVSKANELPKPEVLALEAQDNEALEKKESKLKEIGKKQKELNKDEKKESILRFKFIYNLFYKIKWTDLMRLRPDGSIFHFSF